MHFENKKKTLRGSQRDAFIEAYFKKKFIEKMRTIKKKCIARTV